MNQADTLEIPRTVAEAASALRKVVTKVLHRLRARLDPRCAVAFSRASWWDQGPETGIGGDEGLLFAPAVTEWPIEVKRVASEIENEEKGSPILRVFRRAEPVTAAFGRLISDLVKAHDQSGQTKTFASQVLRSGAYDLVAVVEFDAAPFGAYPMVTAPTADEDPQTLAVGLLTAAVQSTLQWFSEGVSQATNHSRFVSQGDIDSILRYAATLMFSDVEDIVAHRVRLGADLFLALDSISALRHEGAECSASILVTPPERIDALRPLVFRERIHIREAVLIRKVLEMAAPPLMAISEGQYLVGLGPLAAALESPSDEFTIRFEGQHRWSLSSGRTALAEFRFGFPSFPIRPLEKDKFDGTFRRIFPRDVARSDGIWALVTAVIQARHGALLVVTDNADAEANRLSQQSTLILPAHLSPEQAVAVSRMDGAVLLDPQGACHGVGVILDGLAVNSGSRSRGARFNSAIRYISGAPSRLAVVCSEDGNVDLLPRLRPPARLSDLKNDLAKVLSAGDANRKALRRIAERVLVYSDFLELDEQTLDKVVPFLLMGRDIPEDDPSLEDFDPHPTDLLPEPSASA